MSWITLDDHVGAIRHLLAAESVSGPVNLTAPNPVTNAEFTRALGERGPPADGAADAAAPAEGGLRRASSCSTCSSTASASCPRVLERERLRVRASRHRRRVLARRWPAASHRLRR